MQSLFKFTVVLSLFILQSLALDLMSRPQSVFRNLQRMFTLSPHEGTIGETWSLCDNPESHLLQAKRVEIIPAQPVIGQDINVILDAECMQQISSGRINVQIKLGPFKFTKQFDLCQALGDISDIRCPINKGPFSFKTTQKIPKEMKPLPVKGNVKIVDDSGALVTCVDLDLKLVQP